MRKRLALFSFLLTCFVLSIQAQIPRTAPDVGVNVPGGSQIHLSQYRGKVVALVFILTT